MPTSSAGVFTGHQVVFTGKLSSLGRREAQQLVERLGGDVRDEITAKTTMLVVGAEGFGSRDESEGERSEKSRKLRKAALINQKTPEHIRVIAEDEFCRLAGVPSRSELKRQFYSVRDISAMYPAIHDDHVRYMEQWGLVHPVARTNADRFYEFSDLLIFKQAADKLAQGLPVRSVLRQLQAERSGQLAFDFRSAAPGAEQARVLTLQRKAAPLPPEPPFIADPQEALAAKYFIEGAALDEPGDIDQQERAATAYRKALVIDPDLVPAIVNLANIHYARDELIEAQALYERAIILDPECFEGHFNLGNIHHDLGRYDEAVGCYRDAVALKPDFADAHFYLAVTLEKMGQSQQAKPHWKAYQRLAPDGEWIELAREFSESP